MTVDILLNWLPLVVFLVMFVFLGTRQSKTYGRHVSDVMSINNEIIELNRKNHEIAQQQLRVLQDIKSLLEDRKS